MFVTFNMGRATAKFYRDVQKGNEVEALSLYVRASKELKNFNPNVFYGKCSHGNTPMHYAAKHAMRELLEKFLYVGNFPGDPEVLNSENKTCLHLVCKPHSNGSGGSVNGGEPFSVIAYYRSLAVASSEDKKRCEAMKLYQGEAKRRADCLELLLNWRNRNGFPTDLTLQDNQGNTALHIAAQNGLLACVKLLRLAGAPLFLENNDKKTACDLCEKNPYLSEVAQYLESAMVFNYEKDSQKFCIEEINALKCEIFKYEIKGQSKEDYDFGWTSRNNYVSRSSNCNSNSSGSENNEMSTNNGSNDNNTTKTAGTISPEQSERCWIQSSFTRKELVALREAILFSTASALAITEDEAELLLCKNQWQKDSVIEQLSQSYDRLSLCSRRCSKLSGSINQSHSTFNFNSISSRASSASIELPKNIMVNGTASSSSGESAMMVSAEIHSDYKVPDTAMRRASATASRKCSTTHSIPGPFQNSSVPQTPKLYESKFDHLTSTFLEQSEPLECEICFCTYDPLDSANTSPLALACNHSICFSCLFEYIKLKILQDRKSVIECPAYKCNLLISSFQVREIVASKRRRKCSNRENMQGSISTDQLVQCSRSSAVSDADVNSLGELLDLLDNNVINCFVEDLPDIKWCPSPDCHYAVKLPKFLSERPCVNYYYSLTANPLPGDILSLNAMIINHNIADDLKPGTSNGSTGQKRPLEVLRPHSANGIPINKESNSNTSSTAAGRVNTRGAKSSESSLQVVANERLSSVSVTCSSGHYFCWYCLNEGHQPASCKHWAQWFQKIDEVKPNQMGTKDIWESAEYAANYLWFITQSKQCPKCSAPIQKVDGCNHMKCAAKGCRHEFCWICLTPWSKHGSETGGFWRCNRFETEEEAANRAASATANATTTTGSTAAASGYTIVTSSATTVPATSATCATGSSKTTTVAATTANPTSALTTRSTNVDQSSIAKPVGGKICHNTAIPQPTTGPNTTTAPAVGSNPTAEQQIIGLQTGKIPRSKAQAIVASSKNVNNAQIPENNPAISNSTSTPPSNGSGSSNTEVASGNNTNKENNAQTPSAPQQNMVQPRPYRIVKSQRERTADLHKFLHYYSRYYNHKLSMKLEQPLLDQAQEKVAALLKSFNHSGDLQDNLAEMCDGEDDPENEQRRHLTFLERAIKELILTRKVLSASYVFAYYLSNSDHESIRSLFEYMQIDLEETAENLAQIVNREHLSTPWFLIEKAQLIVKKKRYDLLDATTRGVLPADTSPIFKRKRKTFHGVQVCMDPLKMNMSERQAVMASLYEMVCHGDGWLVDSTGCHNNIPMLYGQEDFYQKTIPETPCKIPVGKHKFCRKFSHRKGSKASKKSEPLVEYIDIKDCARKTCGRKISTPCLTPTPPKRKVGITTMFFSQKRSQSSKAIERAMRANSIPTVSQGANFCSLACMRRDKLEGLEAAGFTPSGQRCTPTIPNEDSPLLLDNEFPPVFLDNEKIDRERREIVKRNYELLLKEQENALSTSKLESAAVNGPSTSDSAASTSNSDGRGDGASGSNTTGISVAPSDVTGQYNNDAHLIQCCSYAESNHMNLEPYASWSLART